MATVLYVPKDTRWEDAGKAVQQGIETYMQRQQEEEEMRKFQAVLQGVNSAPDQATAMNILTGGATALKKPEHISTAFRLMSEKFPPSDNSLVQGKVYSTVNGEEQPFWFERKDASKLKDMNFVGEITGLEPGSFSMSKPKTFEFVEPESGESFGFFTPEHRPPGAVTTHDFQRDMKLRAEDKANKVQERADKQFLALQEERKIDNKRADARLEETQRQNRIQANKTDNNISYDRELRRVSAEQTKLRQALDAEAQTKGAKAMQNGMLDLSGMDRPSREIYLKSIDRGTELLETNKGMVWGKALRQLHKEFPEPKSIATPPPAKPADKSAVSNTQTIKLKNGKIVKAKPVLDARGKQIGWQPVE